MLMCFKTFDQDFESVNQQIQALLRLNAIKPVIAKLYRLEEVVAAHEQVVHNEGTLGRLAFEIN